MDEQNTQHQTCHSMVEFQKRYLPRSYDQKAVIERMTAVDLGTKLAQESIESIRDKLRSD